MTKPALKEKLHEYIKNDDKRKVQSIYTLVENEIEYRSDLYDEVTLNSFRAISEDYFSGKTKSYTVEESMNRIRKQISKK